MSWSAHYRCCLWRLTIALGVLCTQTASLCHAVEDASSIADATKPANVERLSPEKPSAKSDQTSETIPSALAPVNATEAGSKEKRQGESKSGETSGKSSSDSSGESKESDPKKSSDAKNKDDKKEKKKPEKVIPEREGFDILAVPLIDKEHEFLDNAAQKALRSAQVHLKLAVAEFGNVAEFDRATDEIDRATGLTASSANADAARQEIKRLRAEVHAMRTSAHSTFFGQFPLVREFGLVPDEDEDFQVISYAKQGDAFRRGVFLALNKIAKAARDDHTHVLVLVPGETVEERLSSPLARMVDSQARGAFNIVAGWNLHLGAIRAEINPQPYWDAPDPDFDPLCRQLLKKIGPEHGARALMLVMVREFVDEAQDGHWIQAQQRTYEPRSLDKAKDDADDLKADTIEQFEAVTRDRSRFQYPLAGAILLLYLLALALHWLLSHLAHSSIQDWHRWFLIPTAGFVIGLALAPFIMLAMRRSMPDPISNAVVAAWWPATAGAMSLILPAGVFRLVAGTAGRYFPQLSCHSRWGNVFVPVAIGVCAAWVTPAVYALGLANLYFLPILVIAASSIVYGFGRAVDIADEFPVFATPIAIALSLLFGIGAFAGSSLVLAAVIVAEALAVGIHYLIVSRLTPDLSASDANLMMAELNQHAPRTVAQLAAALQTPKYLEPRALKRFRASIQTTIDQQTRWIGICGPASAGKSKAAQFLIDELNSEPSELQLLVGHCVEQSPPYHVFREALSKLGASAGLLATSGPGGEVNTFFERLADEFIPFWDFFSVDADKEEEEGARHDLIEGVMGALRKLSLEKNVVLLLEDLQWIDEGSAILLKHLRETFPVGSDEHLTIILTSREASSFEQIDLTESILALEPATAGEQVYFLQNSFGIEQASAKHLVKALGVMSELSESIFWLIWSVSQLVEQNAFVAGQHGLRLLPSFLKNNQLPVPDEMRAKLGTSLRESGQYRPVLEFAALLGEQFRVDDLANCLRMDRLLLLQILRHLEQELQLVRDLPHDPECYAFSSVFMRQIVQEELGVGQKSDDPQATSKIARELHARIAEALNQRTPRTPKLIFEIARHSYAAGNAHAQQCVDHCLEAADTARRQYAFSAARSFLNLAQKSANELHRSAELTKLLKQIDIDEQNLGHKPRGTAPLESNDPTQSPEDTLAI